MKSNNAEVSEALIEELSKDVIAKSTNMKKKKKGKTENRNIKIK